MPQQQHRKFPPQCHPTPEDRPPPAAGSPEHKIRCAVAKPKMPPPSLLCVPRNHIAVPSAPPRAPSPSARSKLLRSSDHRSRRGASHKAPPLAEWGHSPDETGRSTKTDRGQRDLETNPATAPGGAHLESGPSPRAHLDRFLESITQKLQPAPNLHHPNKTPLSTPVQRPCPLQSPQRRYFLRDSSFDWRPWSGLAAHVRKGREPELPAVAQRSSVRPRPQTEADRSRGRSAGLREQEQSTSQSEMPQQQTKRV